MSNSLVQKENKRVIWPSREGGERERGGRAGHKANVKHLFGMTLKNSSGMM